MLHHRLVRTAVLALLMLSVATVVAAEEPTPEATPAPDAEATPEASPVVEELPPLDCKTAELLEKVDSWSVDCVAMWLDNLGFPELRTAFTGNKINGTGLKDLTMEKLADDYGVSDEDQRKKIFYNLKDVLRKDNSSGNTNHYTQMFFWVLPFLGLYKWMSLKYDKQIAKAMKRYKKWQEVRRGARPPPGAHERPRGDASAPSACHVTQARNPPKAVEPVIYADGTNEWTVGLNKDVSCA